MENAQDYSETGFGISLQGNGDEKEEALGIDFRTKAGNKCPHCGAEIDLMTSVCLYCGGQLQPFSDINSSDCGMAIKEFHKKLSEFEAQQFVGIDIFKKKKKLKSLILNYPIPNDNNGIIDFMILCCSHINTEDGVIDEIEEIWVHKAEDVYQKGCMTFGTSSSFIRIKELYEEKIRVVNVLKSRFNKQNKYATSLCVAGIIGIFLALVLLNYRISLKIVAVSVFLLVIGFYWKVYLEVKKTLRLYSS